jgi:hypothetical protein
MKKLAIIAVIFACGLVFGCGNEKYTVTITNATDEKTVSYSYNGSSDTLAPQKSKTYEVRAYTKPPENYVDQNDIASIDMEQKGDSFTFVPATSLEMEIMNTLPVDVKRIKADNFISYSSVSGESLTVSVPAGNTISSDLYIYTDKPNFSLADADGIIEPSYPIIFDWNIVDNKMFVTIR